MRRLASLCLLVTTSAAAQEADVEVVDVVDVTPPPAAAEPLFRYDVFGFLRLKGGVTRDDPNVAFVGRNDGFTLQNARIGLTGALGDRLAFRLSADGAVDERGGVNSTAGTLRVALKDAFLDVRVAGALTVRVVRFEPIFDLEELVPYTERAFIDRSLESRGVLATHGYETAGLSPGRSLGVALRSDRLVTGGPFALGYELAVQNGNGEYESQNDNNSPAFSAALFATFGRSLVFVAGRQKNRTVGQLPFRQTEEQLAAAGGARLRLGPVERGGQLTPLPTVLFPTGGPAENSAGAHAQLSVAIPLLGGRATLAPGYRYAVYDPSDLIATDVVQEHTAGLTLSLTTIPLRLQLNVTHAAEQAQRQLVNDRLEAAFEVVL
jgi:hypothetical protein